MSLFVLSTRDIDAAGLDYEEKVPLDWLRDALSGTELLPACEGELCVRLSKSRGHIVVRGRVRVDVEVRCARCLGEVLLPVDAEISLFLEPAGAAQLAARRNGPGARTSSQPGARRLTEGEEYEFSPEEAELDTYEGDEVTLDRFVREHILLEAPIFPLCSEACPGIRPAAGPGAVGADAPRPATLRDVARRFPRKE